MNILFTGVGRRIELLQAFRNAALVLNKNLKIFGADMEGTAPALSYCDYTRKVVAMKDTGYIDNLIQICTDDHIDLLIPTIDTDLLVLSESKRQFEAIGTRVLISAPDKIRICRDKNNTSQFFADCGLHAPMPVNDWSAYKNGFPAFIKPKDGSSSINAFKAENAEELKIYAGQIEDYIVQPFIEGKEYTIDIFCDFDGNPIYITPRERVQVRAGEVLKTMIYMDDVMIEEAKTLCKSFKPCGPMTVQLIQDKNTGDNYYIEINPRYGGGAPLSMKSGARSAEALLKLIAGEKVDFQENASCDGAVYSRFDQSVCISAGNGTQPIKGVIFDLDDTLYSEKQYVRSGYKKIGEFLGRDDAADKLWAYFKEGKPALDAYLAETGGECKKAECLRVYREQMPEITLYDGVKEMIRELKGKGIKVGIITDGRPEGQRNKLKVLRLDEMVEDIIITDELGGIQFRKPNDISFRIIQNRWRVPFEQIIYVGDNPNKDFQAPKQLGMRWVYFANKDSIHNREEIKEKLQVADLNELLSKLGFKGYIS